MKIKVSYGLLIIILMSMSVTAIDTTHLYHFYTIDENTGSTTIDEIGNLNMTIQGNPVWTTGKLGYALEFDGTDDCLRNTASSDWDDWTAISVNGWYYMSSTTAEGRGLWGRSVGARDNDWWVRHDNSQLWINTNTDNYSEWLQTSDNIGTGTWNMITFVYNGSEINYYRNGGAYNFTNTDVDGTLNDTGNVFEIGCDMGGGYGQEWGGKIDEFGVWANYSLTINEIEDLYNLGDGVEYPFTPILRTNITLKVIDEYSNTYLNTFNITINNMLYNTTNGTLELELNVGNYTVIAQSDGFESYTSQINITNTTGQVFELTITEYQLLLTAINAVTGENISSFEVNMTEPSTGIIKNYTSSNSFIAIGINLSTFYFHAISEDKAHYYFNYTFSDSTNLTISFQPASALEMNFYDELTNSLIDNQSISVAVIDGVWANNFTTSNGTLYLEELVVYEYEIIYSTQGYNQRSYFVEVGDDTFHNLSLYLLDNTLSEQVEVTIQNQFLEEQENYTINTLALYIEELSPVWKVVEMSKTNFNGNAVLHIDKDDTKYKFIILDESSNILLSSSQTYITEDSITFRVGISGGYFVSDEAIRSGSYVITQPHNKTFQYAWNDPTGYLTQTCLKVNAMTPLYDFEVCEVCSTISTGILNCNASNYTGTITAIAFVETSTNYSEHIVGTVDYIDTNNADKFGGLGVFMGFLIVGTLASIGIWSPSVSIILGVIGLSFSVILGLVTLGWSALVGIIIIGFIIAFKGRS